MINICVPVLKRYDLLKNMVASLPPDVHLHVIDNGRQEARLRMAVGDFPGRLNVHVPKIPMGVAESWNHFIANVPEERLIVNDDVIFASDSIAKLTAPDADLVFSVGVGFSCFVIRDSCIAKIGLFDESISPGYGYYEDEDYLQRIDGKGTKPPKAKLVDVESGVVHLKSQTLEGSSPEEQEDHHRKFCIARHNYVTKWDLQVQFQ